MNILYDLIQKMNGDWESIRNAFVHDPRIGESHTQPVNDGGRGAGGHCFIKDFEAFRKLYEKYTEDSTGSDFMKALAYKNLQLLVETGKDVDLLKGVYGNLDKHRVWKNTHDTML